MARTSFLETMTKQATPRVSPLTTEVVEKRESVLTPKTFRQSPVYAPAQITPPDRSVRLVTREEVDAIGNDAGKNLLDINRKVMASVSGSGRDEMSKHFDALIKEAKGLDPTKYVGFFGKLRCFVRTFKVDLYAQFQSSDSRMQELALEISKHLENQKKRKMEIIEMIDSNDHYGQALNRELEVHTTNLALLEQHITNLEAEGQDEEVVSTRRLIDRLEVKLTNLRGFRLLAANMKPKLENMLTTADALIDTGNDLIKQMIPAYMSAFSAYVISLEQKEVGQIQNNAKAAFNEGVKLASDLALENTEMAAHLANGQMVSIETLKHDLDNVLKMAQTWKTINEDARGKRVEYISAVQQMESQVAQSRLDQ